MRNICSLVVVVVVVLIYVLSFASFALKVVLGSKMRGKSLLYYFLEEFDYHLFCFAL